MLDHPWGRRILAALPYLAIVLPHLDFVPIWDGAVYGECLDQATRHGVDVWALNCSGHPSMAYMLPLALAFKASGGAAWAVLLVNALLGAVGVGAYLDVLDHLMPEVPARERLVGAAAFGLVPAIAASTLNLGVDFGTLVLFLLTLSALLRGARWWAALAGIGLAFTKEPGIALAGLATAAYLVSHVLREPGEWRGRVQNALKIWPMLLVPAAFAAYLAVRASRSEALVWEAGGNLSLAKALFSFEPADKVFRSFLAAVFGTNFTWIPLVLALAGFVAWAASRARGRASAGAVFAGLLFVGATYVLTRYKTYTNVRYFLGIFPLVVACGHLGLARLAASTRVRTAVLGACAALFAISNVRTVDPVSRAIFGTIPWGGHEVLNMTSITGECCGFGRDQLVYDLEFTHFHELFDDVLAGVRPQRDRPLVLANRANWFLFEAVTPTDPPKRALPHPGRPRPFVASPWFLSERNLRPPELVWLDVPNAPGEGDRAILKSWGYEPGETRTYDRDGYTVTTTTLHRRTAP